MLIEAHLSFKASQINPNGPLSENVSPTAIDAVNVKNYPP